MDIETAVLPPPGTSPSPAQKVSLSASGEGAEGQPERPSPAGHREGVNITLSVVGTRGNPHRADRGRELTVRVHQLSRSSSPPMDDGRITT